MELTIEASKIIELLDINRIDDLERECIINSHIMKHAIDNDKINSNEIIDFYNEIIKNIEDNFLVSVIIKSIGTLLLLLDNFDTLLYEFLLKVSQKYLSEYLEEVTFRTVRYIYCKFGLVIKLGSLNPSCKNAKYEFNLMKIISLFHKLKSFSDTQLIDEIKNHITVIEASRNDLHSEYISILNAFIVVIKGYSTGKLDNINIITDAINSYFDNFLYLDDFSLKDKTDYNVSVSYFNHLKILMQQLIEIQGSLDKSEKLIESLRILEKCKSLIINIETSNLSIRNYLKIFQKTELLPYYKDNIGLNEQEITNLMKIIDENLKTILIDTMISDTQYSANHKISIPWIRNKITEYLNHSKIFEYSIIEEGKKILLSICHIIDLQRQNNTFHKNSKESEFQESFSLALQSAIQLKVEREMMGGNRGRIDVKILGYSTPIELKYYRKGDINENISESIPQAISYTKSLAQKIGFIVALDKTDRVTYEENPLDQVSFHIYPETIIISVIFHGIATRPSEL